MADEDNDYSMYELVMGTTKYGNYHISSLTQDKKPPSKFAEVTKKLQHITRHAHEGRDIKIENLIRLAKKGSFFCLLATIEAALVASVSRGCKAFQKCGGIKAYAVSEGMGIAPVFIFRSVDCAVAFYKRLPDPKDQLRRDAEATSRYIRLLRLTPHIMGMEVHVLFEYACGDAAGQNMVTIATHKACPELFGFPLAKELGIFDMYSEGHMSADKQINAAGGLRYPRGV